MITFVAYHSAICAHKKPRALNAENGVVREPKFKLACELKGF